jgi:MscS family membrane protein
MVEWTTVFFGNTIREYVIFIGFLAAGLLVGKILSWILQNVIKSFAQKTATKLDDVLVEVCEGPLVFAIFVGTLWYAERLLYLSAGAHMFYGGMMRVLFTVMISWFLIRFLDSVIEHYLSPWAAKSESDLDDVLLPIMHTAVKVIVVIIAGIMILSDFGFNVTGLVAGVGIGGLAIAFAAQDLVKNIFGGVSVIADKPFKIGDMVKFDGRQGTIRQLGIRTTRIETLDGTTLVIPNAKFTDGIVENVTKRNQHRVMLVLGLQYDTDSKRLAKAKEILQRVAKEHPGTKDETQVFFSNFGASSIDLTFIYFVTDLKQIPQVQDQVNTRVKEEFEKEGIEFAYPTTTVIMKREAVELKH